MRLHACISIMAASMSTNEERDVFITSPQDDDIWHEATTAQRVWFVAGCVTLLITLAKSILAVTRSPHVSWTLLHTTLAVFVAYLLADLVSGIYHWAIDNYGSPQTPLFGPQIEFFQVHHQKPWETTRYETAYQLYIAVVITTIVLVPINMVCNDPVLLGFVCTFAGCAMFTLKIHAWAHTPEEKLPPVATALHAAGVIIAPAKHGAHHQQRHNNHYCGVSGMCNWLLDSCQVFLALEILIFHMLGARPRSWDDPKSD